MRIFNKDEHHDFTSRLVREARQSATRREQPTTLKMDTIIGNPDPASLRCDGIVLPPGAAARIRFLRDPAMLNVLFDAFQDDGMPMGSDRWAEYVLTRYRELCEKERTLAKMLRAMEPMEQAREYCGGKLYREQRRKLTEEFQERKRREEAESETQNIRSEP